MANYGFAIPFKFNSQGKVDTASSDLALWRSRVYLTLMTRFGERLMRPDFGADLAATLFENEQLASEIATRTIGIAFNKWLPGLKLIEAVPLYRRETGLLDITVRYTLPTGSVDEVIVSTSTLSRTGEII